MNKYQKLLWTTSALSASFLWTGAAFAQAAVSAAPAESGAIAEIVVTGSRIARSTTFSTPTPVTDVSIEQLKVAAPSTIADGLKTLPSIAGGGGPTAGGGTGNGGQNFLNLRGLGTSRTLTLLNGHRFTTSSVSGTVDSNLMPSGLVSRVDVVTGGASAAYGSDAVGGVINFILDTKFSGWKLDAFTGQSGRNDNKEVSGTGTFGTDYMGGRGHLIASGEYYNDKGVNGDRRNFRTTAPNLVVDPNAVTHLLTASDLRTPFTNGGMIVIGAGGTAANNAKLEGIQFGANGAPIPYSYGTLASDIGVAGGSQNGGDGFRVSTGQEIVRPLTRKTFFARTDFKITDAINAFAEASYGYTESVLQNSPTTRTSTIQRDNAYLATAAPSVVAQMNALGVTRFTMNRLLLEGGLTLTDNINETKRILVGLNGDVRGWKWEASYQDGQNTNTTSTSGNAVLANYDFAVDAVVSGGKIVCRATLPGASFNAAAAGCVPMNLFGAGSPSADALAYVFPRPAVYVTQTRQKLAEANVSGTLFNLPAGPVSLATGYEHREESASTVADALSNAGAYRLINNQDFAGAYKIDEVFVETLIPVLANLPAFKSLDVDLAARRTHYSTSGNADTWKIGVNWSVFSDLRLRGTWSEDIRAPNLTELFATGRQNNITIDDTLNTGKTFLSVPNKTNGNPNLTPEIAHSAVLGFVYQPSWLTGFNLAVDAYSIRITNAIANVGGQQAVTVCNQSHQTSSTCALIIRDPNTKAVVGTLTSPANLAVEKTSGVDFEATYRAPISTWFKRDVGNLTLRALVGNVREDVVVSPLIGVVSGIDQSGENVTTGGVTPQPHWRANIGAVFSKGRWTTNLQARYIGSLVWDKTRTLGVDTDFNSVAAQTYLDGQISFRPFGDSSTEIYLNVQNLLDKGLVFDPSTGGATPLPTNPAFYDQVGRMFRIGVKLRH